jgi:hypothetical protein
MIVHQTRVNNSESLCATVNVAWTYVDISCGQKFMLVRLMTVQIPGFLE